MKILMLAVGVALSSLAAGPPNSVIVTNLGGDGGRRPFTISRFFARGEIQHFARARVNREPLETQCDVKTRWPDGSVQHALVSFLAQIPAGAPLTIDFIDQPTGNNAGGLTQDQMLSVPGWGAKMQCAAKGAARSADARVMLAQGAWRYWLQGRLCTQVIVEASRDRPKFSFAYDFGWRWDGAQWIPSQDPAYQSLHPIFVLTFYRGWKGVKIDYILENTWTTKAQDQEYALSLYRGDPPELVHARESLLQPARTRWRKTYWSGDAPAPVRIDYNLPYLIHSRVLPSYDLSKVVSQQAVTAELTAFRKTDQGELGGKGQWQTYFPSAGGRGDIGLFPRWYVRYLYTFDPSLYGVMLGDAAVSGYVPVHYRESLPGRLYSSGAAADSFGRPLSIDARPTFRTANQNQDIKPPDALPPVGPATMGGWTVDLAHQPSFAFIPYLITGDWYFLEELYFWAAYDLARGNPGTTQAYHRHVTWGILNNDQEIRGVAWALRNLAHAALAAPDGTPEKAYFTEKLTNNLAVREGMYKITDGAFYQACQTSPYDAGREVSKWCWGRNTAAGGKENPLHFLEEGNTGLTQTLDPQRVYAGSSPWMLNFNHVVLGYLKELDFPVGRLQETMAKNLLHQIVDLDYNPYLVASYRIPVLSQPGKKFISTWADVKSGYLAAALETFREVDARDAEHGYLNIAAAAASFLPGITDGPLSGTAAWNWMSQHAPHREVLNDNPKWALVPRPQ
jgi:hypothetical protein